MANTKSAIKRASTSSRKKLENSAKKSALRKSLKKALLAIESDEDNKQELVNKALKMLDEAASYGVIHKNKAARLKSNLAKKV